MDRANIPMTNAELIKALRWCGGENNEWCVDETYKCPLWNEDRITDECKAELMRDAAAALEAAEKRIAKLEAQLPKEGEWKPLKGMQPPELHGKHYCSNCDHIIHLALNGGVYNYCPNCGAKMDGKENDDERLTGE